MSGNCLFCNQPLNDIKRWPNADVSVHNCNNCGEYILTGPFVKSPGISPENKTKIASYLMSRNLNLTEKTPIALTDEKPSQSDFNGIPFITIEEMLDHFPKRVDEKLNRALQNLGKLSQYIGHPLTVSFNEHPILYALSEAELTGILDALKENGYISYSKDIEPGYVVIVTAKGYERIYELDKINPASRQGFVAMWFNPSMDNAYDNGFIKAIADAGYEPYRIDKTEFLGKIDGKIIAEIRRSRFLVADFTEFRTAIFYEAGFAKGLGIDVIFTCREDQKDKIKEHFDTRQEKHIIWKDEADLYNLLKNSITANIGWGPKAKKEESKQVK